MARPREGHEVLFVEAPIGLKERLRAVAKHNHRSVNGEAVAAIERHVKAEEASMKEAGPPPSPDKAAKGKGRAKG